LCTIKIVQLYFKSYMLTESQIDSLWNEYYQRVFAYFYKRINSYEDTEELAATSMTLFLSKVDKEEISSDAQYGYLWKIVRTQLANHLRIKLSKPIPISLENDEDFEMSDIESKISAQYESLIQSVFQQAEHLLKPDEFLLLKLSFQDGKNSIQIADQLSSNPVVIRKRLSRIIKKLKTTLKPI
jgi:RNA polymerase sigma factor (sigma-70 family)